MREFTTEAKVGLLVVAVLVSLFLAVRATRNQIASDGNSYYATLDSAAGIAESTTVQIAGVPVGQVEKISERDGKARIKIRIEKGKDLPLGTTITTEPDGMLGNRIVKIVRAPTGEAGGWLEDGDTIPSRPNEGDLDSILKRIDAVARNMEAVTDSMRNTVGTPEGEQKLQGMVDDFSLFADNLAQVSSDNREALNQIVENMLAMSERLNQVIDGSGEDLDETFVELKKAAGRLDSSLASIDSVAGKIDRGEGTLGRLVNDDETVESLNDAVGGVNDILERVNRIHVFVNYQGELQIARADGRAGEMKNSFLFRIQPHADYGYLLGLSDDPDGFRTRSTTTRVVDGIPSVTETEKTTSDYLYTAQFFKRYGRVAGRIGLKEGSGGVGADLWLSRDRFKLSADAYQFSRERKGLYGANRTENPRVKVQGRYDLHRHAYVVGGMDDILSNYDRRAFFVGAGFEFNDDDLKFLMGSVPTR
jgi:phospholipid/cholesterol/gamma-HCH transport system substrate-binding protein